MQRLGRCPRCGYVLRFDGRQYRCDFCGYPRTEHPITSAIRNVERNVKDKVQGFVEGFRRQRQVYVYYPVASRACSLCGANVPVSVSRCPSCGTIQPVPQPRQTTPNLAEPSGVDRKVFDYIVSHEGTISLSQASRDLAIPNEVLQTSIDRLKSSGMLNQT